MAETEGLRHRHVASSETAAPLNLTASNASLITVDDNTDNHPQNHEHTHASSSSTSAADPTEEHTAAASVAEGVADTSRSHDVNPDATANTADEGGEFDCNICLDQAQDAVISMCGHLFCWPCLARWLENKHLCPVCKAGLDKTKVIPLYGRGKSAVDPRNKDFSEPRPAGQRTEATADDRNPHAARGFQAQFGFGAFGPFPFAGVQFHMGNQPVGAPLTTDELYRQTMSKFFLILVALLLLTLVF